MKINCPRKVKIETNISAATATTIWPTITSPIVLLISFAGSVSLTTAYAGKKYSFIDIFLLIYNYYFHIIVHLLSLNE